MLSSHARRHLHVHLPFSMSGVHASRHTGLCMSVRMRRSQVLRHLVLLCVELHGTVSCTSTPPSCVDTKQVKWLTPRPDPLDQATSSFSVDLRYFGSSAHTGRPWLSISTHISTLILGLRTLTLPVDILGDSGPGGLFVQYTQDVCGCPPEHTGHPWLSVSTHRTSVAVRVCRCVSVSTHKTTHRTSVGVRQHTQDVRGCPCLFDSTHSMSLAVRVCPSSHKRRPWMSISTHISTLVLGLSTLALPVDCSGDFGPCGLSVQYTQDVRGCPPAHTGRPCVSVSTHRTSVAVRECPCVSVSTHMTTVAVHQCISARWSMDSACWPFPWTVRVCPSEHTGRPCAVCVCPSAHTRRPWLCISTHISTLVLGLRTLALPVDFLGDFGPRGLSVKYTQDVRGCLWLSVSTHRTSVAVRGCLSAHTGRLWLFVAVRQHTQDVCGCPCVSVSTHRTSVAVHQYTYQHAGPWTQHAGPCRGLFGRPCVSVSTHKTSVAVRVCPFMSVSTHRTTVAVHQYISSRCSLDLARWPFPWTVQDVRGCPCVSVCVRQHTEDVCGCPSVHISARWTSVGVRQNTQDVRGCLCVSVSTHKTSVAVHQYTYQHAGPWTQHVGPSHGLSGPHKTSVGVLQYTYQHAGPLTQHAGPYCGLFGTHMMYVAVHQYTYQHVGPWTQHADPSRGLFGMSVAVRECPCVSVCVCQHTGHPWLSISTHISTLVLGISTLALPVDYLGEFGPRGLSVGVRQHTGRMWLSVAVRQHTQTFVAVCGFPSAHTGRLWLFVCVRVYPCVSVCVRGCRQHTQDVRGCPSAHTGRLCVSVSTHRTSVCVCVCPSAHTGRLWLSISTHISTLVLGLSTLALPVDCLGDFGPRGLSVQYTQDGRGCPPAHTGHLWLSVSTHWTSVAVRVCPCVSVFVHQHTQDFRGCPSVHISARWSLDSARWPLLWTVRVILAHVGCLFSTNRTFVGVRQHTKTYVAVCVCPTLTLPVDCSGDFGQRELSVQYIHDVRGCPLAQTGCQWLSVSVRVCPSVSVSTQDIRGYPSVHISARWSLDSARWPFPWTIWVNLAHVGCLFSTHRTSVGVRQHTGHLFLSVAVRQHTQTFVAVCGFPSARTGRLWLFVCVRVCPWVSPAHTGRPWLSVSTHKTSLCVRKHTQDFRVCLCVSVSTHRTSVAVHQYTYQHVGSWCNTPIRPTRPWSKSYVARSTS
ncbi:hypothetical protein IGI04_035928 [Brassica rapa subsp. trilocularis]|uniref:Uncharacterized protein n=1 Tax=Brassica rapa subsp. trilocularis TaxID=1813537 RepID=A0ABQ7LD62_BRACM|nr:hypothetical protein IGI04_035928 [Brassica rapa subsp. trilocularis]